MANVTNPWAVTPFNPWGAGNNQQTPFGYGDQWTKWFRDAMSADTNGNFGAELGLSGSDYGNPAQQQNVISAWIAKMQQAAPAAYVPQLANMAQSVQRDWYARRTADPTVGTLAEAFGQFDPLRYFRRNASLFGQPAVNPTWRFL